MPFQPGKSGNTKGRIAPPLTAPVREAKRLMKELSLDAVQELRKLITSPDERIAVAACKTVIDKTIPKPDPENPWQLPVAIRELPPSEQLRWMQEQHTALGRMIEAFGGQVSAGALVVAEDVVSDG